MHLMAIKEKVNLKWAKKPGWQEFKFGVFAEKLTTKFKSKNTDLEATQTVTLKVKSENILQKVWDFIYKSLKFTSCVFMWLVVFVTTVDSAVQKLIWKTVDFSKTFKDWLPHLQIVQQSAGGEQRESQINDPNTVTMFVHLKEHYTTQEGSVSCKESKIK